jgi:hypothetical protein
MQNTGPTGAREREQVRLAFLREYRHLLGFSSVSVRCHPETGRCCLYVGAVGTLHLPASFSGLPVIAYRTRATAHAGPDPAA